MRRIKRLFSVFCRGVFLFAVLLSAVSWTGRDIFASYLLFADEKGPFSLAEVNRLGGGRRES